jgi:hypothetical protein
MTEETRRLRAITVAEADANLAYNIPSLYTNFVHFAYINGVFRVTFFEQHLGQVAEGSSEVRGIVSPRVSVIMVPQIAGEFLKSFGELYNTIAKGVLEGAATMMPSDESGRPN